MSVIINGNQINSTIVSSDSTWELGVPGSRITGSSATPSFAMGGQDPVSVETIYKGPQEEKNFPIWIVLIVVLVILSIGAFGYFFLEFDTDDETKTNVDINLNSGNEHEILPNSIQLEKHDEHPGWLWDNKNEEWVPDPEYSE